MEDARMNNEEREQIKRCGMTFEQAGLQAYEYGLRKSRGDRDKAADFYLDMVPLLHRMLDRYTEQGSSFRAYLCRSLKFRWITFAKNDRQKQERITVADTAEASKNTAPHEIADDQPHIHLKKIGVTERRGLFCLALACPEIDQSKLQELSRISGVPVSEISSRAESLKKPSDRADTFRARRDRAYARLLSLDWRMRNEVDPDKKAQLATEREVMRLTLTTANAKLIASKIGPTHAELAKELGIPKGTIDSSIFLLLRSRTQKDVQE